VRVPQCACGHGKRGRASSMSWQNVGNDEVEVDFWKLEAHLMQAPCVPPLSCCLLGRDPAGEQEFRPYNSAAF
jgi:hypothetical protein